MFKDISETRVRLSPRRFFATKKVDHFNFPSGNSPSKSPLSARFTIEQLDLGCIRRILVIEDSNRFRVKCRAENVRNFSYEFGPSFQNDALEILRGMNAVHVSGHVPETKFDQKIRRSSGSSFRGEPRVVAISDLLLLGTMGVRAADAVRAALVVGGLAVALVPVGALARAVADRGVPCFTPPDLRVLSF